MTDVKDKRVFVKQGDQVVKYGAMHIVCAIPYLALNSRLFQEIRSHSEASMVGRIYIRL